MTSYAVIFNIANYTFTLVGLNFALVGLLILSLGAIVLGKEGASPTGIIFFFGCFLIFALYHANVALVLSVVKEVSVFWAHLTLPGYLLGAVAIYHATMLIVDSYEEEKFLIYCYWGLGILLTVLGMSTDLIIGGTYEYSWGRYPKYSRTGIVAVLFVFSLFFIVLKKLTLKSLEVPEGSRQFFLLRWISIAFGVGMVSTIDWLPAFGLEIPPVGVYFTLGSVTLLTFIVVKYSLNPMTTEFAAEEILSTMDDGLLVTDQVGKIRMVNNGLVQLFGIEQSDLVGEPVSSYVDGSYLRQKFSGLETEVQGGEGETISVSLSSSRLEDEGGHLLGWVMVLRDIRDRKETERKLHESEERFRQLAENIEDVFWLFDCKREEFLYWSPAYERIFEEPIEQTPSGPLEWARRASSGSDEASAKELGQQLMSGEEFSVSYQLMGSDGRKWIVEKGVPVRDETGSVYRVAGLARDVTDMVHKNMIIREKNRELEQFAYAASRELEDPLRQLMTFRDALDDDLQAGDTDGLRQDLDDIYESAKTMEELIQGLLQLSKAGRDSMEIQEVSLEDCVRPVLEKLSDKFRKSSVTVREPEVWPTVKVDPSLLQQVVNNLLENSLEHSEGSLVIELLVETEDDRTIVGVRDNGDGIDPSLAQRLFRPFDHSSVSHRDTGTGIGLGVCKKIVERHGGEIWLNTQWENGTFIQFSLPDEPGGWHQLERSSDEYQKP